MIPVALTLVGLGLVGLPARGMRASRTRPQDQARLGVIGMTGGLTLVVVGMWLLAAPLVLGGAGRDAPDPVCRWLFGHATPGGTVGAVAAAALGTVVPIRFLGAMWRSRSLRRRAGTDPAWTSHMTVGGQDVAVVPHAGPLAFASTSPGPRVVISQGLVDDLDQDSLAAVVRHEAAHLHHRHDRALLLTRGVAYALAPLRTPAAGAAGVEVALERWADEAASGAATRRRQVLRQAILRTAALAGRRGSALVELRSSALLRQPPSASLARRLSLYGVAVVTGVVSVLAVLVVAADVHGPFALLSICG